MDIEEKFFERKRFDTDAMLCFGFQKTKNGYIYESDFMSGDFSARLTVSDNGKITGKVIDRMNNEEYVQLRMESFQGPYVNSVREAYVQLLKQIAEKCCKDVLFSSDQANRIAKQIEVKYGVMPDYPWAKSQYDSYGVFRHVNNSKWFALIMNVKRNVIFKNGDTRTVDIVNLKIDPSRIVDLTQISGIYPAYHMNRKYWISVTLDDTLSDEKVLELINESFHESIN